MKRNREFERLLEQSSIGHALREMEEDPEAHLARLSEDIKPKWMRDRDALQQERRQSLQRLGHPQGGTDGKAVPHPD